MPSMVYLTMPGALLGGGADPEATDKEGRTVSELLEAVPAIWERMRQRPVPDEEKETGWLMKQSEDLSLSPEEYVARHYNIIIWGFMPGTFSDPKLREWVRRVRELLGSQEALEACYREHLTGETRATALRGIEANKRRDRLNQERKERERVYREKFFPELE